MADTDTNPSEPVLPDAATPRSAGGGLRARIKMVVFVLAVVGVECAMASYFLPSSEEIAEAYASDAGPAAELADTETPATDSKPTVEYDLGQYSVTAFQPISNTTLRIDFQIFAVVYEEDVSDLTDRFTRHEKRLRDQVLVTVRSSEITDLTDSGLGLIKRKILEKSNRIIGKPLIQNIVFSEFSFVEQ